jgi:hypothetical protein
MGSCVGGQVSIMGPRMALRLCYGGMVGQLGAGKEFDMVGLVLLAGMRPVVGSCCCVQFMSG